MDFVWKTIQYSNHSITAILASVTVTSHAYPGPGVRSHGRGLGWLPPSSKGHQFGALVAPAGALHRLRQPLCRADHHPLPQQHCRHTTRLQQRHRNQVPAFPARTSTASSWHSSCPTLGHPVTKTPCTYTQRSPRRLRPRRPSPSMSGSPISTLPVFDP